MNPEILLAVIAGSVAYSLLGILAKDDPFNWRKAGITLIVGVLAGAVAASDVVGATSWKAAFLLGFGADLARQKVMDILEKLGIKVPTLLNP